MDGGSSYDILAVTCGFLLNITYNIGSISTVAAIAVVSYTTTDSGDVDHKIFQQFNSSKPSISSKVI